MTSVYCNPLLHAPSNGIAAFNFLLTNTSPTGETWTYGVTAGPESNANGAIVKLNGAALDHNVLFAIPWGEQVPITITVERGPQAYTYEGLEVVLFSLCHDARANGLGIAPDDDPYLYSAVYLNVFFEEPCSEVDISSPQEGWVIKPDAINPATQNILPITVSGYDKKDADLVGIRLQYRPSDGNGAWINITDGTPDYLPKDSLGDVFEVFNWNTDGTPPLADGAYEVRAVTICNNRTTDQPGYSHVIKGRIERQPPSLVGTPEAADGVFQTGDEISFSFNKDINCNKIIEADLTQPNNVGLYDAVTGQLIDVDITCRDNKIVLVPKFQNAFFENHILRAEIRGIQDKIGNKQVFDKWEFYVDRNELAWLTDSAGTTQFEGEAQTFTASIHNRGGAPMPFQLLDLPTWVRAVPDRGTLAPNEIRVIQFETQSGLGFGHWQDSVTLRTVTGQNPFFMGGDEHLPIGVRVVCRPPVWKIQPEQFEHSMNVVLQVNVEGAVSDDVEDLVAAFIDDELRGVARLQFEPSAQAHLAFLTVFGNTDDADKDIRFEIWDASACLRYGVVKETLTFEADMSVGTPQAPQIIHTNRLVLREIPIGTGWNWLSFNLGFPNNKINNVLASLRYPDKDLFKSQTAFSTYSGGWFGSLQTLDHLNMYVYRADRRDTLRLLGNRLNPAAVTLSLDAGWNWIGYVPDYPLSVNEALAGIKATAGDLLKSQAAFAQYVDPNFGWVGSLKQMSAPNGYQIRLGAPANLIYPPAKGNKPEPAEARGGPETPPPALWSVHPAQFEHNMTLIGMIEAAGSNVTAASMELGVFAGQEVRGSAQAIYVEPLQAYLFFLTVYANNGGEPLAFKLFDAVTGQVRDLQETMFFAPDQHQGSLEAPVPFRFQTTGVHAGDMGKQAFEAWPNPFDAETVFRFALPLAQEAHLTICDAKGRTVAQRSVRATAGLNTLSWKGIGDGGENLPAGIYWAKLQTETGSAVLKMVLWR